MNIPVFKILDNFVKVSSAVRKSLFGGRKLQPGLSNRLLMICLVFSDISP